jgi:uracil phosphoribosyltransferase
MTSSEIQTKVEKPRSTSPEVDPSVKECSNVHISKHPVLSNKISILRSSSTAPASFRSVLREITFHLGYEATSSLTTKPVALTVPVGKDHIECTGKQIAQKTTIVPILRSGLGMTDPMLELLPDADVHHIGMYKRGNMPVQYYNRLPKVCESDVAYVLDPIIATAKTVMSLISILKKWGVGKIHVIAVIGSESGIKTIATTHPDVQVTVGTIDTELTDEGVVLPGLGDAGDRLFGTSMIDDDEALLHPSKRRKTSIDE